jgi:hypothetical protein
MGVFIGVYFYVFTPSLLLTPLVSTLSVPDGTHQFVFNSTILDFKRETVGTTEQVNLISQASLSFFRTSFLVRNTVGAHTLQTRLDAQGSGSLPCPSSRPETKTPRPSPRTCSPLPWRLQTSTFLTLPNRLVIRPLNSKPHPLPLPHLRESPHPTCELLFQPTGSGPKDLAKFSFTK